MEKKIAFFHSTLNTPAMMSEAFKKRFPDVPLINVVDDSILPEVMANGDRHTPGIVRRLVSFAINAQIQGAVAAVCMCTTLGGAVAEAAKAVDIPFITIDEPMLEKAVQSGEKIALIITARTTRKASSDAARAAASRMGRDVQTDVILVEGAFEALNVQGDKERHDALIEEAARKAAEDYDVIVLAQATMAFIAERLTDLTVPVLTSVESGIEQLTAWL
ncbi:MAG: Asp/Glu racemase [Clostridiaceae bacterium]|nr:Asp/Glu racemase [Clostridiaceae bacterium]